MQSIKVWVSSLLTFKCNLFDISFRLVLIAAFFLVDEIAYALVLRCNIFRTMLTFFCKAFMLGWYTGCNDNSRRCNIAHGTIGTSRDSGPRHLVGLASFYRKSKDLSML